jgi:hypothetical protein
MVVKKGRSNLCARALSGRVNTGGVRMMGERPT